MTRHRVVVVDRVFVCDAAKRAIGARRRRRARRDAVGAVRADSPLACAVDARGTVRRTRTERAVLKSGDRARIVAIRAPSRRAHVAERTNARSLRRARTRRRARRSIDHAELHGARGVHVEQRAVLRLRRELGGDGHVSACSECAAWADAIDGVCPTACGSATTPTGVGASSPADFYNAFGYWSRVKN